MKRFSAQSLVLAAAIAILAAAANAQNPNVQTGDLDGAPYRIQVPAAWNRGLVMYVHGYLPRDARWRPMSEAMSAVFLARGFAVAESGYSRQGWAVEEALRETEALRKHFAKTIRPPDTTFIVGGSMGGLITLATIESHPDDYDGALPMCGPLVPAMEFLKDRAFDMLVTFETLFGDSLPRECRPVVESPALSDEAVDRALSAKSDAAMEFAARWAIRRDDLPSIISFYHLMIREVMDRAGGNPFDNRNTLYAGYDAMPALNEAVPRYASDPKAAAYVIRFYTPTGKIQDPVLALHTTYDPGVPTELPGEYCVTAALEGNESRFVQLHVCADGHCRFTPASIGHSFDALRRWAATGIAPEPGAIQ